MPDTVFDIATRDGPIKLHRPAAGAGPRLLWVHGYTLDSRLWAPLWRALPGWDHIGIDLPGHGGSRAITPADTIAHFAAAVIEVADRLEVDDLIGLSFGGTVCLEAAGQAPSRFRRLILSAPALPGGPEDQDAADCNQELRRLARDRGIGPWLAERWLQVPPAIFAGAKRDSGLFAQIAATVGAHRWDELFCPGFAPRETGLDKRLTHVTALVLLILGDDDIASFARTAELLRRRLPHATIAFVADAGHLAPLERPAAVARLVADHLAAGERGQ
ncbi:alpha/beta fold hydrolase [Sphingomonas sp. 28-63-12]|uniref:alpha/beta fold hydrolase n=1 Tax=Sphingomonas sp. 28-63-12 TaxID=1970434 RepID=UPI0035A92FED